MRFLCWLFGCENTINERLDRYVERDEEGEEE